MDVTAAHTLLLKLKDSICRVFLGRTETVEETVMILVISIGGAIGAVLRYFASLYFAKSMGSSFPWGTLLINMSGSLGLGIVYGVALNIPIHPQLKAFITIGLLGAFTTFSTFSLETVVMLREGEFFRMALYLAGTTVGGMACAFLGITVGGILSGGGT